MNIILVPFLLLSPFLANTLDTRCHERHTSIVFPPIVETKSPITRGRTMIKSFEIGTLPFASDPSSFLPPIIDRASNEQLTNVLFPSFFPPREIKRIKKKMCLEGNFISFRKNVISILVDLVPVDIDSFGPPAGVEEGAVGGISVEKRIEIFPRRWVWDKRGVEQWRRWRISAGVEFA